MKDNRKILIRIIGSYIIFNGLIYLIICIAIPLTAFSYEYNNRLWVFPIILFVLFAIVAICFIISGVGLWLFKKWGRYLSVNVLWILVTLTIIGFIGKFSLFLNPQGFHLPAIRSGPFELFTIVVLGLNLLMLWYLSRNSIKQLFSSQISDAIQ
jgi:hypothetical protein